MWHEWRTREVQGVVGEHEGKRPLGRPRGRWEVKIKLLAPEFFILF
jgi:hypothetical protein